MIVFSCEHFTHNDSEYELKTPAVDIIDRDFTPFITIVIKTACHLSFITL